MESQINPETAPNPSLGRASQAEPKAARPFVKWAGGKGRLLQSLLQRVPEKFGTYFEPFLGGGALFFALQPKKAVLSDMNTELITTFTVVRDDVESLIEHLRTHKPNRRHFQKVREQDRRADFWTFPAVERASRFIFLNKTCFNGLCRVNSDGQFNVPYGMYKNPKILDEVNLRACSKALQKVTLSIEPYLNVLQKAAKGDFIYFDPPYVPLTVTSSFVSYSEDGFSMTNQQELAQLLYALDKKGVQFMLTNSNTPASHELYREFQIDLVDSPRSVSADGSKRGPVKDVLVRNYR